MAGPGPGLQNVPAGRAFKLTKLPSLISRELVTSRSSLPYSVMYCTIHYNHLLSIRRSQVRSPVQGERRALESSRARRRGARRVCGTGCWPSATAPPSTWRSPSPQPSGDRWSTCRRQSWRGPTRSLRRCGCARATWCPVCSGPSPLAGSRSTRRARRRAELSVKEHIHIQKWLDSEQSNHSQSLTKVRRVPRKNYKINVRSTRVYAWHVLIHKKFSAYQRRMRRETRESQLEGTESPSRRASGVHWLDTCWTWSLQQIGSYGWDESL